LNRIDFGDVVHGSFNQKLTFGAERTKAENANPNGFQNAFVFGNIKQK
jgi:hypothetical protein